MWGKKMADEIKPKVEVPKDEKSRLPWLRLLFSIFIILVALNNFFVWLDLADMVTNVLLLLAGVWILVIIIMESAYRKRSETLKKYI